MSNFFFSLVIIVGLSATGFAKQAPQFQAELIDGKRSSLKQNLKPGRALLVSFWATWCTPCLQELKEVSTRLRENPELPIDLLTINVDTAETSSDVAPTLRLHGFKFPVALDPKHEIFSKYQGSKSLPFTALVDSNGEILKTFSGYDEKMFDEVRNELNLDKNTAENKV
jgi:peroxiredoxin